MSGSAVLGGAFGFSRASAAAQDDPAPERLGFSIVQGGVTAAVAAGVGAFAWKSRDILAPAVWGTARGIGESATRSMSRAFQTKGLTGMLSHPLTVAGFGTVAGGLIGSKLSDDPVRGSCRRRGHRGRNNSGCPRSNETLGRISLVCEGCPGGGRCHWSRHSDACLYARRFLCRRGSCRQ